MGAFAAAPLCFPRRIDALKATSTLSLAFVGYLTVVVVAASFLPSLGEPAGGADDDEETTELVSLTGRGGGGCMLPRSRAHVVAA